MINDEGPQDVARLWFTQESGMGVDVVDAVVMAVERARGLAATGAGSIRRATAASPWCVDDTRGDRHEVLDRRGVRPHPRGRDRLRQAPVAPREAGHACVVGQRFRQQRLPRRIERLTMDRLDRLGGVIHEYHRVAELVWMRFSARTGLPRHYPICAPCR